VSVSVQEERQTVQDMYDLRRRIEPVVVGQCAQAGAGLSLPGPLPHGAKLALGTREPGWSAGAPVPKEVPRRGAGGLLRRLLLCNAICGVGIGLAVALLHVFHTWLGFNLYVANPLTISVVTLWNVGINAKYNWGWLGENTGGTRNGFAQEWLALGRIRRYQCVAERRDENVEGLFWPSGRKAREGASLTRFGVDGRAEGTLLDHPRRTGTETIPCPKSAARNSCGSRNKKTTRKTK